MKILITPYGLCHCDANTFDLTNYKTNWQSTNPLKPWNHISRLTTTFYFSESVRLTEFLEKCNGPFLQWWFCSVKSPCIIEAIHWSHPLHRAEIEWKFGVSTCSIGKDNNLLLIRYLDIFILHFVAAVPLLENDNLSPVCGYIIEICPVLIACTWKNCVLLAAFWDKILIFHLGQADFNRAPLGTRWCSTLHAA